jgi:hypothetical protein
MSDLKFENFGSYTQDHDSAKFTIPVTKVVLNGNTLALVYRCYLNEDWDGGVIGREASTNMG